MELFNKIMAAMFVATVAFGMNAANDAKSQVVTAAFYATDEKNQLEFAGKLLSDAKAASPFEYGKELAKVTGIEAEKFVDQTPNWMLEEVTPEIIVTVLKANQPSLKANQPSRLTRAKNFALSAINAGIDAGINAGKWCWDNKLATAGIVGGTAVAVGGAEFAGRKFKNVSLLGKTFAGVKNAVTGVKNGAKWALSGAKGLGERAIERVTHKNAKAAEAAKKAAEAKKFVNKAKRFGKEIVLPVAKTVAKTGGQIALNYGANMALNALGADQKVKTGTLVALNFATDLCKRLRNQSLGLNQFGNVINHGTADMASCLNNTTVQLTSPKTGIEAAIDAWNNRKQYDANVLTTNECGYSCFQPYSNDLVRS